jgi:hypothetical protein
LKPAKIEPAVILLTPDAEPRRSIVRAHNIIDRIAEKRLARAKPDAEDQTFGAL